MESTEIIFIGGTGRCGTGILKNILSKHTSIATINGELRFIIDSDGLVQFYNAFSECWDPFGYDIAVRRLEKLLRAFERKGKILTYYYNLLRRANPFVAVSLVPRYSGANLSNFCENYPELIDNLIEKLTKFKYSGNWKGRPFFESKRFIYNSPYDVESFAEILRDFVYAFIRQVIMNQNAEKYIEGNDWNFLYFNKLLEMFPHSKLIHIYRDPRDVVSSYLQQNWTPKDAYQATIFYKDLIEKWWSVKDKLRTDTFLEISLEQLVNKNEETIENACNFLEIEWEEELLKTDLSRSNAGRWRKDLTIEDQQLVNSLLSDHIEKLGYIE